MVPLGPGCFQLRWWEKVMKINRVSVVRAAMAQSWLTETVIATPLSGYPAYRERRSSWFGRMTAAVVRIETDDGIEGLGYVGGGKEAAASVVDDQFADLLVGKDPFDTALIWDL